MKAIFTSDIHVNRNHLSDLLSLAGSNEVKCVIIGGDFVPHELPGEKRIGSVKAQGEYLATEFIPAIMDFKERNPGMLIFLPGTSSYDGRRMADYSLPSTVISMSRRKSPVRSAR
jgi:hypothetical protein